MYVCNCLECVSREEDCHGSCSDDDTACVGCREWFEEISEIRFEIDCAQGRL